MAEKLYTIPVNEAFEADCECPLCLMHKKLEEDAVDFTMGPSYMDDDVRMETNRLGFCERHVKQLYAKQNRLGLALMLLTHMDRANEELYGVKGRRSAGGLFKKPEKSAMQGYYEKLENSCYVCKRMENTYDRYIVTIFYLYSSDEDFVKKFEKSKGFCMKHYVTLSERAATELSGSKQDEFRKTLDKLYFDNMRRVREDLQGFIDKFDYRNADKPWGNSKDALIRAILKMNSTDAE